MKDTAVQACRFCSAALEHSVVDLGLSPLCQNHIEPEDIGKPEMFYPLHAKVCSDCLLVQVGDSVAPGEIFSDYAYFSSYSDSWVEHARRYVEAVRARFGLDAQSQVVELASNDGYLLQHFVAAGVPVLGIEPAANVAEAAREKGIDTLVKFFGAQTAREVLAERGPASLLLGNNVLAHVPDLNDFVAGMKILLAPDGVITMEFPHLLRLLDENQFDTIYHEHFSYFSFTTVRRVFAAHGMTLFDVDEIPTHGGSLRIYGCHDGARDDEPAVEALLAKEREAGLLEIDRYRAFGAQVERTKRDLLAFLIDKKNAGKTIVGYGAPGKGNTLLNYCGIREDLLDYTVDISPHKQGRCTPGARLPILAPERILETRPDYVLILPWNIRAEIVGKMAAVRDWGGQFVVPIPSVKVV